MSIKEHPPQDSLNKDNLHVPVLYSKILECFDPKKGESYLDLTAGYGGHAKGILNKTLNYRDSVLVDRDINSINFLKNQFKKDIKILHMDFISAANLLILENRKFDLILVDLGVSSPQLDNEHRGFSFMRDGPLDMRMDNRQQTTASDVINKSSEEDLIDIIYKYGEENLSMSRKIAHEIVLSRPIYRTKTLSDLINRVHRGRRKKIHPATRTFQALRIVTNDELNQIMKLMPILAKLLKVGGRVGIISFHSLEDKIVKKYFQLQTHALYESEFNVLTKKPIKGAIYDVNNPRSRSALLRVAVKK